MSAGQAPTAAFAYPDAPELTRAVVPEASMLGTQAAKRSDAGSSVAFTSILYQDGADRAQSAPSEAPAYFHDFNLDQVVHAITEGKAEYNLAPFFYDSLKTTDAIFYRHEVMRDLEDADVLTCIKAFAIGLRQVRDTLAQAAKLSYDFQKERWFLHAVETYCVTVRALTDRLARLTLSSRGLLAFRDYVSSYATSDRFVSLVSASRDLAAELAAIQYCLLIKGSGFTVRNYDDEPDYSAEVAETFKKFQQGAVKDYRVTFSSIVEMNHIEAKVLDFVALLNSETFSRLAHFVVDNQTFADPTLTTFDREIQFYVAYLDYITVFKTAGLAFSYPMVSATDKEVHDEDGFDLALAGKLIGAGAQIVCNDVALTGAERILVVSGPNQGGKTTFARTFGQLHHLATIGCPVAGRSARLFLFDRMFSHFEKEENIQNLRGKLQDDLIRFHAILEQATPGSILVMNEIFNSTTVKDAVFLARKVIDRIIELDALCVCVTFLDELASLSEKTVSMVSTVVPDDPAMRTYKVVRRPADGRSYAISIAEKYRLTYDLIKSRLDAS